MNLEKEENLEKQASNISQNSAEEVKEYSMFMDQVGGHSTLLTPCNNKNYVIKPSNQKELQFYQQMQENSQEKKLLDFLPKFLGTTELNQQTKVFIKKCLEDGYIKLQNLTKKYKYPCVLDIKMGFKAPSEKHKFKFENSTSRTHGFRLCGLNVYLPMTKKPIFKDKYWGQQLKDDQLCNSVALYFFDGNKLRKEVIEYFIQKLLVLKETLESYKGFVFQSSSLLMVYEGSKDDTNQKCEDPTLKLIDFANIMIQNDVKQPDNELINGINNLVDILKQLKIYKDVQVEFDKQDQITPVKEQKFQENNNHVNQGQAQIQKPIVGQNNLTVQ